MIKILTVIGARPQFIKASAFSRAALKHPEIEEIIVHTGQHFDENMSKVFFEEMNIPQPKYNLGINSLSHAAMTAGMMQELDKLVDIEKPHLILVYGDTNSTLAAAIMASKLPVKLAHIEAGLRSFNNEMPEEINRILTDRVSDFLYCPTQTAIDNLLKEGFENFDSKLVRTGDIMLDSALYYASDSGSNELEMPSGDFILATIHRAENTGSKEKLEAIILDLNEIHQITPVLMPIHPRTRKVIESLGLSIEFKTIDPVGYLDMLALLKHSNLVITDSGGLQKEAYFFEKMCLTVRDQTEWVELIEAGCNQLVDAKREALLSAYEARKDFKADFSSKLYGDGTAADKICADIIKEFS